MLKEATIYFCPFDELHFSNIYILKYGTIKCVETNRLRKYRKKIRSSQTSILINSCAEFSKTQFSL